MAAEPAPLDFERDTLPFIDKVRYQIEDHVRRQTDLSPRERFQLRTMLFHWMWGGFVVLERAVEPELIDALLEDVEDAFAHHEDHSFRVLSDRYDHLMLKETDPAHYYGERMRLVDFHQSSVAGKKISLHRNVLRFIQHVLPGRPVMMQSLTFFEGSQQLVHQDHAYVIARIPSHLCASWVALEDIDPDAGPLEYVPCSHAQPMYDWGNGMFRNEQSTGTDELFAKHIRDQAEQLGLDSVTYSPKKGDVLIWHSALAHAGSPVVNPDLTRKSYVTHYSVTSTYDRHYRDPTQVPVIQDVHGAAVYVDPVNAAEENSLRRGERF